jgi:amidase
MARTVKDAAILLGILAGDSKDPVTNESKGKATDYTKFLDAKALQGKRIGGEKTSGPNQFMHELQKRLICLKNKVQQSLK